MSRLILASLIAGAILASNGLPPAASGQEAVRVRVDVVDTSAYPQLRAMVTVSDSAGRPIADLPPGAFTAGAGGSNVSVVNMTNGLDPNVPAAVVATFDSSGSMSGPPIEQAREAGKALVSKLGPNDQASVIKFSNAPEVVQPFTNDRAALTAAIDSIQATGNTALYDAVVAAAGTAGGGAPRRAIVLLSDGLDAGNVSTHDRGGSLAAAQAAGVPFFVIGLGDSVDQAYLQELANITRGQLFLTPSPNALQGLYETIGTALRSQYLLDLDAAALDPATAKSLEISVNDGARSGSGQTPINLSAFVIATPPPRPEVTPPVVTPPVEVPVPPVTEVKQDSTTPLVVPVGVGAGILLVLALALFWRRRRGRRKAAEQAVVLRQPNGRRPTTPVYTENDPIFVGSGPADAEHPDAWLEVMTSDQARRYALDGEPITVGFTSDCTIFLPNGSRPEPARVRLWRREGRYMLHNLSRLARVTVEGKPATWAVLEDGDEILLGAFRVVFRDASAPRDEPAAEN
jgi:VWFA-related protein